MKNEKNIETRLEQLARAVRPDDSFVQSVMSRLETSSDTTQKPKPTFVRRLFMKPITKFAAAAAVVAVAVLIITQCNVVAPTFADVVGPLLNARTLIYDFVTGPEDGGTMMHDIVVESRIRRTISTMPTMTMIIDIDNANMLLLDSSQQKASYQDMRGPLHAGTQGFLDFIRTAIRKTQENSELSPHNLGTRQIDGRPAVGYQLGGGGESVIIWADTKTALPMCIELGLGLQRTTLKNFRFDVPVEAALVSMDVPDGYTVQESTIDLSDATEEDFIAGLKVWAELLLDGRFPDGITTDQYMKQVPLLEGAVVRLNIPEKEAEQMGMHFIKGMMFITLFEVNGHGRWHYAGSGVKLGDAATPIFWYRPKDAHHYRVIFGDLSVREMAYEDLVAIEPKAESVMP